MVRVGGMAYTIDPQKSAGNRISDMMLDGKLIDPDKTYKVAGWAPVTEGVKGEPIWDVVARDLRDRKTIGTVNLNEPRLKGVDGNHGIA